MTIRKKIWLTFFALVVLVVVVGYVDYPKSPDINIKWGDFELQKELKVRLGLDLQGGAHLVYEADLENIPPEEYDSAMAGVRDVIERRVNSLGLSEPIVQTNKVSGHYRVIVELAGVTDVNEAINLIGQTPSLDFREIDDAAAEAGMMPVGDVPAEQTGEESEKPNEEVSGEVPNETSVEGTEDKKKLVLAAATEEPTPELISEEPANTESPEGESTELNLDDIDLEALKSQLPEGQELDIEALKQQLEMQNSQAQAYDDSFKLTALSGQHLKKAELQFDPQTNQPVVALTFNNDGKKLFAEVTDRNVGKPVGIFLDGQVISAPRVNEKISDGVAIISGSFTVEEAKLLAQRLNAGALPVPISLVSQTTIGPTLGKISIERSFIAGVIGLVLVAFFMIVYYRLPGVLAVISLAIYTMIVLALFKLIPITLTLAGIAGFILSIGMAVDANVLIFERMREELRKGKNLGGSVEEGFKHAWTSIRDSNISSLITCLILAWFGTSIIRGFAITLAIGILVSMFSAITITRTFLRILARSFLSKYLWLYK
ncbi:protein translocase subunit SecD [Patescibacteria group bacterium]|nr:protein translocase subunit SecD [Patescibacteria group bacterium]